jgi:hypothetical protein
VKTKIIGLALFLFLITMAGVTGAEEKFGVTIYPGAKFDRGVTDFLKQISPESAAYRTGDKVEKVMEYYKKSQGMNLMGVSNDGGMFKKGNIDITIQNPWMDTKTGKMIKDTLISIVKNKE